MAASVEFVSERAAAETVYALPVKLRNSPVYCANLPGHYFDRDQVDGDKQHGRRINLIPNPTDPIPDLNNPDQVDVTHARINREGRLEIEGVPETMMHLAAHARHFVIPFPGKFLNVNATKRGQIDLKNSYAIQARDLANTIEFLLSSKGIDYSWAGFLTGEEIPEDYATPPAPNEKKPKKFEAKKPLPICVVDELVSFVPTRETNWEIEYGITGKPESQTMTVTIQVPEGKKIVEYPRFQVFWEMVPLFNKVNVDMPANLMMRYPDHLNLDAETPLGYLLCHFVLLDPRLSLMKGLKRLRMLQLVKESKGLKDGTTDNLATKYQILPRNYVLMMSALSSNTEIKDYMEYESPNLDLYREGEPLNLINVLGVKPIYVEGEFAGLTHWRMDFKMSEFEKERFRSQVDPNIPSEDKRPQLQYHENYRFTTRGFPLYLFHSPNRVIKIDAAQVYPSILNNAIIPFFNKSTKRNIRLDIQYSPPLEFIECPWNVTCPSLDERTATDLETSLQELVAKDKHTGEEEEQSRGDYTADVLRKNLGADILVETITCSIKPNEPAPIVTAKMIGYHLISDIERDPNCPTPLKQLFAYMKQCRKQDSAYSLFQDLFDPEGLNFKYYRDMSVASTYTANFYDYMDRYHAVYQAHKGISLLDVMVMLQGKMRFGNQLYVMNTGKSNIGKSYATEVIESVAVPGTLTEQDEESNKVKVSGIGFCGEIMKQDDAGSSNNSLFSDNEKDADATMKSALTKGFSARHLFNKEGKQKEKVQKIWTDLRRSVWANSNAENGIVASLLTRVLLNHILKANRFMNMANLSMRIEQGDVLLNTATRNRFSFHYRNRQVFCALMLYFARAGALQYNYRVEGRAIVSHMLKRFKEILTVNVLNRDSIPITSRMEEGQIYPIAEGFMLSRIYATICSGVWTGKSKHLYPGAPFDYDFIDEINRLGLMIPIEEDVLKAISYYEEIASQETVQEIVNFIMSKFRIKRITKAANTGSPMIDLDLKRNINENAHFFEGDWENGIDQTSWELHWSKFFGRFFLRASDTKEYLTDFNWIDLVKLCDLPNDMTNSASLVEKFADAIKSYNTANVHLDKNLIMYHLNEMLSEDSSIEDNMIIARYSSSRTPFPQFTSTPFKTPILASDMQVNQEAVERTSKKTVTLNIRTTWLRDQLKMSGTTFKTVCYPYPNDEGKIVGANFMGSSCETAIQLAASHDHAFEQVILLNGMPYHRASPDAVESRRVYDMPQILKQIRIIDTARDEIEFDPYRTYLMAKMNTLGVERGLVVKFNEDNGQGEVFSRGGNEQIIKDEYDYFSTDRYMNRIYDQMRSFGYYRPDGTVAREEEDIKTEYLKLLLVDKIHETYSPIAAELLFRQQRIQHDMDNGSLSPDYQTLKIEAEMNLSNMSQRGNQKKASVTFADTLYNMGIIGVKRTLAESSDDSTAFSPEYTEDENNEMDYENTHP